jgi:uncharacterized membrane protein
MTHHPWERNRRNKVRFAVLAVGIIISALLALGLFYLAQSHPHI